jgi:ABC-2 type transport system permease protein
MSTLALARPRRRVTLTRVIKSEWIKFWSLRSTVATLAVAAGLLIGIGLLASSLFTGDAATATAAGPPGPGSAADPVSAALAGTTFAQLAFGTLGVLLMAGEYGTGMIRSSMAAVPKRLPVLWAKIAVFAGVAFVVALASAAIAFTGGQALIGDGGASWSDPGVARAVIGTAVVLTGSGVLGVGLGAVLRSTPTAITALFGVLFLLPGVAGLLLPDSWSSAVEYLPSNAAGAFTAVTQATDALTPWAGLTVFLGYVAVAVIAAAGRLKRSDV